MRLVIAEKPSVAQSIAAVLGAKSRHDGYLEGSGYIVSWCFGHLAELADAAVYNADDAKWTLAALPIIPTSFRFIVRSEKQKQFDILRELMRREDVAEVVNACDAGREGELIFRTVYCLAGCSKSILRLWISSMEDDAIRSGFQQLKSGRDYDGLHQSALCRAKADWLVGINATRYFSLTYGRTLNIGRVMSPTLALLVQREAEISAFVAEPFYTVQLDCGFPAATDRMKDRKDADAIANACKGKTAAVKSVERKEKSEKPPALYDLTSLQRDANRVLGYTSQQTLDYLQALYEKKLCTYPRTDSRYLTDDMEGSVPGLVAAAAAVCGMEKPQTICAKQVCSSKKVTDHHAIVPTISAEKVDMASLPLGEREVLKLAAKGLLRAVDEPHRYAETVITLDCSGQSFTAKGKIWKGGQHGFARDLEHTLLRAEGDTIQLELRADDAIKAERFPYDFVLTSTFRLEGKTVHHTLQVTNPGTEELRFGIGFHPAFNVPFDDKHSTTDYEFRFDRPESPVILDASPNGLLSGKSYYQWKNQQTIQLTDDLFANDSFCMAGLRTGTIGICEKDTGRNITCRVEGYPYSLIWSAPAKPVRFVCIEPWHSLPAAATDPQDWEQRAAAACLAPGESWQTTLSTTFDR